MNLDLQPLWQRMPCMCKSLIFTRYYNNITRPHTSRTQHLWWCEGQEGGSKIHFCRIYTLYIPHCKPGVSNPITHWEQNVKLGQSHRPTVVFIINSIINNKHKPKSKWVSEGPTFSQTDWGEDAPAWWATCWWPHWAPWTAAAGGSSWVHPRRRSPCWPRLRGPPWSRWDDAGRCAARRGCCTAPTRCFWSGCSSPCGTWLRQRRPSSSKWQGTIRCLSANTWEMSPQLAPGEPGVCSKTHKWDWHSGTGSATQLVHDCR